MVKVRLIKGTHSVSSLEGLTTYTEGQSFEIPEQAVPFLKDRIEIVSTPLKRGPGRPPKRSVEAVVPVVPSPETLKMVLDGPVEPLSVNDLGLALPVIAILKDSGIFSVEQLYDATEASLVEISGIGRARAEQILAAVKAVRD